VAPALSPLPIDSHVPPVLAAVRSRGAVVLVAPPGAGKTTRVPPALCADGPLILLQPRRVAARAIARRIASEQGWTLGDEVGWHVRFERRFSPHTRLLVATEGILTARLQADPLLTGFRTVVLDEFHERSLHADLALALAKQAAGARGDLRIVVMSATLDAAAVAEFLGGCPVLEVAWRPHAVDVSHAPGIDAAAAVRTCLGRDAGSVLCFLPGAGEIRRCAEALADLPPAGVEVLPLHGSLPADEQDAAVAPSRARRVVLATNVAETSLTVAGVTDVVDSGLHKVLRYDAGKGIDRLETERISLDAAEQRAGRAGRTGPGRVVRLWDPRERLRLHREPDVRRVDLAGPVLEVLAWGGDPLTFEWFEPPPREALEAALGLLVRLGALDARRLTPLGEAMHRVPLHPRLARVLLAAGGSRRAAQACAVLSERVPYRPASHATPSDVLDLIDRGLPPALARTAAEIERLIGEIRLGGATPPLLQPRAASEAEFTSAERAGGLGGATQHPPDQQDNTLCRGLLAGYPDRVARRREAGSPRLLLSSGTGAVLGPESGVREPELLLALDVALGNAPGAEARVRLASGLERDWLQPTHSDVEHRFEPSSRAVRAVARDWYGAILLAERPAPLDPDRAAEVLVAEAQQRGFGTEGDAVLRRLRFAGLNLDVAELLRGACAGRTRLPDLDLAGLLPPGTRQELARLAPEAIPVPSGRQARLEYREDGSVLASVKLQELFGLAETPRVGPRREPVLLELLAPNGRPVQTTRDLRGFWERTYPEVRKELRGRYPRHPWPEDPWTAEPTARAQRRRPRS
jgi:ATP-dependent helicase HrpB